MASQEFRVCFKFIEINEFLERYPNTKSKKTSKSTKENPGLSAILCMETNPNQPPLACLLGFSGITSLVIMVWLKTTAAGLGLGQLQLFAICCSLWFWFSSFVFLLIYGGFSFAERRQNTPS